jgi:hypothetical protein
MKITILFMLSIFLNVSVFADCQYSLSTPTFTYSIGDSNPTTSGAVSIARTGNNSSSCRNFFLAFTKGWAGNYNRRAQNLSNGNLIYYNIYKFNNTSGVLKETNDINSVNEVLYGTISKNQSIDLSYYFTLGSLSAGSPPSSGTYLDVVQVQAYSGTYTNINRYEGYKDLYIYLNVAKFVSLSMVDTGGAYDANSVSKTLDFGELEENESLSFDVRIVSNAGYILKISSANNGQLLRVGGSGSKSLIPYSFYASGSNKSLTSSSASPVTIASGTGKTAAGGAVVPIKVTIGSMGTSKDPGTYQDYLTLSVISND